jgi:hypothetical protein
VIDLACSRVYWTVRTFFCAAILLAAACAKASPAAVTTGEAPRPAQSVHTEAEPEAEAQTSPPPAELDVDAFELPPSFRRDWVRKDVELFGRIAAAFPVKTLATTVAKLDSKGNDCAPRLQGLGIEVRLCVASGGYSTCTFSAVSHHGVLLEATASCRTSQDDKWTTLAPLIRKLDETTLSPKGFVRDGNIATLQLRDDAALERARAAVAAELGAPSRAPVPPELEAAFETLTSAGGHAVIGTACGVAGSPPRGNSEMQTLVDAGRADLLRDAMRGMNAGGRVYGYIGLRLLGENTPADDAAWENLRKLDLSISSCGGCITMNEKASEIDVSHFRR